jgi:hypothetical protein
MKPRRTTNITTTGSYLPERDEVKSIFFVYLEYKRLPLLKSSKWWTRVRLYYKKQVRNRLEEEIESNKDRCSLPMACKPVHQIKTEFTRREDELGQELMTHIYIFANGGRVRRTHKVRSRRCLFSAWAQAKPLIFVLCYTNKQRRADEISTGQLARRRRALPLWSLKQNKT